MNKSLLKTSRAFLHKVHERQEIDISRDTRESLGNFRPWLKRRTLLIIRHVF